MKNRLKILIVCIIILLFAVTMGACQTKSQLPAPRNLVIVSNVLEWTPVQDAYRYEVSIEDEVFLTDKTYYVMEDFASGNYLIKVRCIGQGKYLDSEYSDTILYTKKSTTDNSNLERLPTPTINRINGEGLMQWQSIQGAGGYRIYINNVVTYTIAEGNATSYMLTLDVEGSYNVQLQAIGINGQSLDSQKSNVYGFVIEADGKPKLPSLTRPEIRYNYIDKALEWQNNNLAQGYAIWVDGAILQDAEIINMEGGKKYLLNLTKKGTEYAVKALGDNSTFGDSALSNLIKFPLEVQSPLQEVNIEIVDIEGREKLVLAWETVNYSNGYIMLANGIEHQLTEPFCDFSNFEEGDYIVKVKSMGEDIYYKSSPYSQEIKITVKDNKLFIRLDTPTNLGYSGRYITWDNIKDASSYTIKLTNITTNITEEIVVHSNEYTFENEELLDTLIASVKANENSHFAESFWSEEKIVPLGEEPYYQLNMPLEVIYTNTGLHWLEIEDSAGYLLLIDNLEITVPTAHYEILLPHGIHIIKIKALSNSPTINHSPFSSTQIIVPKLLDTPNIELRGDTIYFDNIANANTYTIYCNDVIIAENIYSLEFNLQSVITIDGEYNISVVAVGEGIFFDSLRSKEVMYIKADAEVGTAHKPIQINNVEEFLQIKNAPDAHYKINATLLDFGKNGEKMLLQPMFDLRIPFRGVILGNGCVIKNIQITEKNGISGIFGALSGAYIESIIISDILISGNFDSKNIGVLASTVTDSTLKSISITSKIDIVADNANVGIFAGYISGTMTNCHSTVDIKVSGSNNNVGGIAGTIFGDMSNCSVLKSKNYSGINALGDNIKVGGVTAVYTQATLNAKQINSNIDIVTSGNSCIVGGLFGQGNFVRLSESGFSGNITSQGHGTAYIGAVGGQLTGDVSTITVNSVLVIDANTCYVGGIAAVFNGTAVDIVFENITLESRANIAKVGGVLALGTFDILQNIRGDINIDVEALDLKAGGLSNLTMGGTITNCQLTVAMQLVGNGQAGGLVSSHRGDIEGININVDMSSEGQINVGGIACEFEGNMSNVFIAGKVKAEGEDIQVGGVTATSIGLLDNITMDNMDLDARGQSLVVGGISALHEGNIIATTVINIYAYGTGAVAGAVGEGEGDFEIDIQSSISSNFSVIGGAFCTLWGSYEGNIVSTINAVGAVTLGGVVATNYANIITTADINIIVEEGQDVVVGGISARDSGQLQANLTYDLTISTDNGSVGGAVGIGEGEYSVEAVGNITYDATGDSIVGGIVGIVTMIVEGQYEGIISVSANNVKVGGIAGEAQSIITSTVQAEIYVTAANQATAGIIAGNADYSTNCNPNASKLSVIADDSFVGVFGKANIVSNIEVTDVVIEVESSTMCYGIIAGEVSFVSEVIIGDKDIPIIISINNNPNLAYVGGVAGIVKEQGSITNTYSYTEINVVAEYAYLGGLAGRGVTFSESLSHSAISFEGTTAIIGGISGELKEASIVYFAGTITAHAQDLTLGGFVGYGQVEIADCYTNAQIVAEADSGKVGLFGADIEGNISATFATGQIESKLYASDYSNAMLSYAYTDFLSRVANTSGIVAYLGYNRGYLQGLDSNWILVDDCYPTLEPLANIESQSNKETTTLVLDSISVSGDVNIYELLPNIVGEQTFGAITWQSADLSKARVIGDMLYCYEGGEVELIGRVSGGYIAYSVTVDTVASEIEGEGTEINPYVLDSIKWLHYLELYKLCYFELAADLDLTYYELSPIGEELDPFGGVLYGNNHIITNLTIKDNDYSGFFGIIVGAVIKDLRLENVVARLSAVDYAGLFAGKVINSNITNVTCNGDIYISRGLAVGGVIGAVEDSTINGLGFNGYQTIYNCDFAGGAVGYAANSELIRIYSNAEVEIFSDINYGGLIGFVDDMSQVSVSYSATKVQAMDNSVLAGFVAENSGEIEGCFALMQSNITYLGFASINLGSFVDCYVILPTFVNPYLVGVGSSAGIIGLSLSQAIESLFVEDTNWERIADALPRLKDISGQCGTSQPTLHTHTIIIENAEIVDLSDYISLATNVFGVADIRSSLTDKLYINANGYAVVKENAESGELFLTLQFEGGYSLVVEVIINNILNPHFESGYGTLYSPFVVTSVNQFANMSMYPYAYFVLGADMVMDFDYESIEFTGYLLGNGHRITTSTTLFSTVTGKISDLSIEADISAQNGQYAAVIAHTANYLEVNDISVNYSIEATDVDYVGGLVAYGNLVTIHNLYLDNCTIIADNSTYIGGVVAYLHSNYETENAITNTTGNIEISAVMQRGYAGGIAGCINGLIQNAGLTVTLQLEATGDIAVGGIAGEATSCYDIYLTFDLHAFASETDVFVGGVVGKGENIVNCYVATSNATIELSINNYYYDLDNLSSIIAYFGGIVGKGSNVRNVSVTECDLNIRLTTTQFGTDFEELNIVSGGIAGYTDNINNTYFSGDITFDSIGNLKLANTSLINYVGGAAGYLQRGTNLSVEGTINVDAKGGTIAYVGGLSGLFRGEYIEYAVIDFGVANLGYLISFDDLSAVSVGGLGGMLDTVYLGQSGEHHRDVYLFSYCYYNGTLFEGQLFGTGSYDGSTLHNVSSKTSLEIVCESLYPEDITIIIEDETFYINAWSRDIWSVSDTRIPYVIGGVYES